MGMWVLWLKISSAYRVSGVVENRLQTLVIKFATEQDRDGVYNNLRNLKGKQRWNQISVVQDLTKFQRKERTNGYLKRRRKRMKKIQGMPDGVWKIVGVGGKKELAYITL